MKAITLRPIRLNKIPSGSVGEVISYGDRLEIDIDGATYLIPCKYVEIIDDSKEYTHIIDTATRD